jgi:hypothetical protein
MAAWAQGFFFRDQRDGEKTRMDTYLEIRQLKTN